MMYLLGASLVIHEKAHPLASKITLNFVAGDKDRYSLTDKHMTIHAEFTYYYYPGDSVFPGKF